MKKIITLSVSVLYYSFFCQCQISKGSVLLGGDLSLSSDIQTSGGTEFKTSNYNISPLYGKAIKENLFLGGFINLGFSRNKSGSTITMKGHSYGAGVFVRRYAVLKNNFYGFLQGGLSGIFGKQELIGATTAEIINTNVSASLAPGLSYRISKKLHLEAGLRDIVSAGYSNQKNRSNTTENTVERVFLASSLNNFNSSLFVGFRLLLDQKRK